MTGYPLERIYEEIAFVSYHFHWDHATLLGMEHRERKRWCEEISKINRRLSDESEERSIAAGIGEKSIF